MQPLTRLTIISIFLVILLVGFGIVQQTPSLAQRKQNSRFFCSYGEGNRGAELCARIQGRTFESNQHAERAVDMILKPLGLRRNFVLVPCPYIENAVAATYEDGIRYIVYDNAFMESIDKGANTDWASVSVLAHEIGHHLQGHTTRLVHHPPTKEELRQGRENELEADEFSGFAMSKLGRSLYEAQAAMKNLRDVDDEEQSTHPKRWRRLAAIKRGYENAQSQQSPQVPTPVDILSGLWLEPGITIKGEPIYLEFESGGRVRTRTPSNKKGYVPMNKTWYLHGDTLTIKLFDTVDSKKLLVERKGTVKGDRIEGTYRNFATGTNTSWLLTRVKVIQ